MCPCNRSGFAFTFYPLHPGFNQSSDAVPFPRGSGSCTAFKQGVEGCPDALTEQLIISTHNIHVQCDIFYTFPWNKSRHGSEENLRILKAASEKIGHVSFSKEQLKRDCLLAAYNKRELSSCAKRSLTQSIESLAPELKISCYWKDGRRFFKQSSLAATFCVSDHVSAVRKSSR